MRRSFLFAVLLAAMPALSFGQAKPGKPVTAATAAKQGMLVESESLSGIDLLPNNHTGAFSVRIKHRFTQPATFKLTEVATKRVLKTELLAASTAQTRALQVGRLANGEYKIEVLLPDTVYWKTVRVTR